MLIWSQPTIEILHSFILVLKLTCSHTSWTHNLDFILLLSITNIVAVLATVKGLLSTVVELFEQVQAMSLKIRTP